MTQKYNMPFTSLAEEEEKESWRLNQFYFQEAKRCELAGCVIQLRSQNDD